MKKIKVLAILMAMTLTFSMFATAVSAAQITYSTYAQSALTGFSLADFNSNLANAKYAALYDFGFDGVTDTQTKFGIDYKLETPIVGAPNGETSAMVIAQTDTDNIVWEDYNKKYDELGETGFENYMDGTLRANHRFASGHDAMGIEERGKIKITFNPVDNMKPVAIGYMATGQRKTSTNMPYEHKVTVGLSDETLNPEPETYKWDSQSTLYRFFGYKAPVGEYITSIEIENFDIDTNTNRLRIDDFCVIYEETSKIESGIRISTDANGYIEFNDLNQITTAESSTYMTISPKLLEGNRLVFAGYTNKGKLRIVKTTTETTLNAMPLSVITLPAVKTLKAFVWNKDTLVPVSTATVERGETTAE